MSSTVALSLLLGAALVIYLLWERRDRSHERAVAQAAEDIAAMGEVVATSLSPAINPDRCIGSGACVLACPEKGVIGLLGGQAKLVNPLGCIGHGACKTACPVDAISLVYGTKTRGVELPVVDKNFQTNRPGVYIAGELGGMGLIRNAIIQGKQAADHIIQGDEARGPRRGTGQVLDALIVGAGPAGISATLQLMSAGLRVLLVDREGFGGTILHYPRAKLVMTGPLDLPVYGRVNQRSMSKEDLLGLWQDIQAKHQLPFLSGELVTGLSQATQGHWEVRTERTVFAAANVILALGGRGSPRKLGVDGEEQSKVAYRLLEPDPFAGQHVLVVGGGNSAVETALSLSDFGRCASVSISYRRGQFARCRAENRRRIDEAIKGGTVHAFMNSEIGRIDEDAVDLAGPGKNHRRIANTRVIVQAGGTPPSELLAGLGIQLVTKYGES